MPRSLGRADEVLAKAARENFPVALFVLPRETRRRLRDVYGFARLVDDAGDLAEGDRNELLDWIEADLERGEHPLVARARDLPRGPLLRLIEANRQDQRVSRYERFEELLAYCDLSANPVGELVLHVFGAATPERVRWSDSICTGLQLAEHWQDVEEDYAAGRVYVPQEDLERFGVSEGAFDGPGFRALMAFEAARAREVLRAGLPLIRSLSGRQRLAVAAFAGGGLAALEAVESGGRRAGKAARLAWTRRVL
ncbi:MAG: squalene/phytoene synthase family protein [Gaiellaceae bacterium]